MGGVRRVVLLTLGYIDLPERILVRGAGDDQLRVPAPGVLLETDGGWLLLDTGFNTALVKDAALRARFHGWPPMRPVIPGPGEPLDEELDRAGIDIGDIAAVAVSPHPPPHPPTPGITRAGCGISPAGCRCIFSGGNTTTARNRDRSRSGTGCSASTTTIRESTGGSPTVTPS